MKNRLICPWQEGKILASSVRTLVHNPVKILKPYLFTGDTAMDIGCGMGFFTIPMSGITGKQGKVIAVDLQPEMLAGLQKKAKKAKCANITLHQCAYNSLNLMQWKGAINFTLLFMMLHEVPDPERLIREVYEATVPSGKLLFAEPVGHVIRKDFQESVNMIKQTGFSVIAFPKISFCRSAVFQKTG